MSRFASVLAMFPLLSCLRCVSIDYSEPLATMRTFQRAVHSENWSLASHCFTDVMRSANGAVIESRAFYLTDHWRRTVTIHNFLGPIPILNNRATFVVTEQDQSSALVEVTYDPPSDKDVRLRRVTLQRTPAGWKIAELYGDIEPHLVHPTQPKP